MPPAVEKTDGQPHGGNSRVFPFWLFILSYPWVSFFFSCCLDIGYTRFLAWKIGHKIKFRITNTRKEIVEIIWLPLIPLLLESQELENCALSPDHGTSDKISLSQCCELFHDGITATRQKLSWWEICLSVLVGPSMPVGGCWSFFPPSLGNQQWVVNGIVRAWAFRPITTVGVEPMENHYHSTGTSKYLFFFI